MIHPASGSFNNDDDKQEQRRKNRPSLSREDMMAALTQPSRQKGRGAVRAAHEAHYAEFYAETRSQAEAEIAEIDWELEPHLEDREKCLEQRKSQERHRTVKVKREPDAEDDDTGGWPGHEIVYAVGLTGAVIALTGVGWYSSAQRLVDADAVGYLSYGFAFSMYVPIAPVALKAIAAKISPVAKDRFQIGLGCAAMLAGLVVILALSRVVKPSEEIDYYAVAETVVSGLPAWGTYAFLIGDLLLATLLFLWLDDLFSKNAKGVVKDGRRWRFFDRNIRKIDRKTKKPRDRRHALKAQLKSIDRKKESFLKIADSLFVTLYRAFELGIPMTRDALDRFEQEIRNADQQLDLVFSGDAPPTVPSRRI